MAKPITRKSDTATPRAPGYTVKVADPILLGQWERREWIGRITDVTVGDSAVNLFADIDFARAMKEANYISVGDLHESNAFNWTSKSFPIQINAMWVGDNPPEPPELPPDGYCACTEKLEQYVLDVEGEIYIEWLCPTCDFTHKKSHMSPTGLGMMTASIGKNSFVVENAKIRQETTYGASLSSRNTVPVGWPKPFKFCILNIETREPVDVAMFEGTDPLIIKPVTVNAEEPIEYVFNVPILKNVRAELKDGRSMCHLEVYARDMQMRK